MQLARIHSNLCIIPASKILKSQTRKHKGIKQANKHCLISALTYNLKKYLKFTKNLRISGCMQLKRNVILTNGEAFTTFFVGRIFPEALGQ